MTILKRTKCIILNSAYEPLAVKNAQRGLMLFLKNQAKIHEELPDVWIHSGHDVFPVPTQVVLHKFVKARSRFRTPAKLNKKNVKIRDKYLCQYCGRHESELKHHEILNWDHVVPRSLGGRHEWMNVAIACSTCNNKKADMTVEEYGKSPTKKPYIPTQFEIDCKRDTKYFKSMD
jgi:hypothetical protein